MEECSGFATGHVLDTFRFAFGSQRYFPNRRLDTYRSSIRTKRRSGCCGWVAGSYVAWQLFTARTEESGRERERKKKEPS